MIRILADEINICLKIDDLLKNEIVCKIDDFKERACKYEGEYGIFYAMACEF